MNIEDLNTIYDEMQKKYGAKELNSIYNGGCVNQPEVCFIFMNPTGSNVASFKTWEGKRYPWLGTKNIWKLFYQLNLLDESIYNKILKCKTHDWTEELAEEIYENIKDHKVFITNLGKCTQIDARALPDSVFLEYLDLLNMEIDIIKPKKIITFGNQVSSIFLKEKINVSKCRRQVYNKEINHITYDVYPVFYPVGNGMRNIDKAIEDILYIINEEI